MQLLTLRKFKKLRLLALRGNPVCGEADYKRFVLAHLPSLMFLDFAMVDANEVKDSRGHYQGKLFKCSDSCQLN